MDEMTAMPFDCPRCGQPTEGRFWGPCGSCRDLLAQTQRHEPRHVETGAFEPAMHVVPNQVATKE